MFDKLMQLTRRIVIIVSSGSERKNLDRNSYGNGQVSIENI